MDGEEGREGGREPTTLSSFSSLRLESKLNLNSVLPYADLQKNVPYAQRFIKQYPRQTLDEAKYKVHSRSTARDLCAGALLVSTAARLRSSFHKVLERAD